MVGIQQVAPISHAVQLSSCNCKSQHVNILEYMEHFRAYTDLRNQGATNVGE